MKKVFKNASQVECAFTDDGIFVGGSDQQVYFPYGSIDSLKMSFMGVMQVTSHVRIGTFTCDRKDKAEIKEMIAFAMEKMKTAPKEEPRVIKLENNDEDAGLSKEEQLKKYKELFIRGEISKEEYDARKLALKK